MKLIPQTFSKNGYQYELECRAEYACVYRQIHSTGRLVGYEVMIIRICQGFSIQGRICPDHERLPNNEEWGAYGWTFTGLQAHTVALALFDRLKESHALVPPPEPGSSKSSKT